MLVSYPPQPAWLPFLWSRGGQSNCCSNNCIVILNCHCNNVVVVGGGQEALGSHLGYSTQVLELRRHSILANAIQGCFGTMIYHTGDSFCCIVQYTLY